MYRTFPFATLLLFVAAPLFAEDVTVDSLPPVVVKTVPVSGVTKVDPATKQIKVTFSKRMLDKSWSWTQISKETFPEIVGDVRYEKDGKTCVVDVMLKANQTYVIWLNSRKFGNFKDADGRSAVPYMLVFETGDAE